MLGNLPLHNWLQWLKLFDNISKFLQQRLIHLDKNWKINREFSDEIKVKNKLFAKKVYKPSWDLKSLCYSMVDLRRQMWYLVMNRVDLHQKTPFLSTWRHGNRDASVSSRTTNCSQSSSGTTNNHGTKMRVSNDWMLSPPRVSQQDYIQVEDVFLVPIYISLRRQHQIIKV